jgi:hypothetical protein
VAGGEGFLDAGLAFEQPVHRVVEVVFVDVAIDTADFGEGVGAGGGVEGAGGGELGTRIEDA